MSLSAYLRDNLAAIGVGVLCCLGVAGMLAVLGVGTAHRSARRSNVPVSAW